MVKIITEYGFCFGVQSAIDLLFSKKNHKGSIYLTHPLLHNLPENERIMKTVNASILENNSEPGKDDIVVLSAHGHAIEEEEKYKTISNVLDCTCPLILRRYENIKPYQEDTTFLYLGKKNHQETIGFLSHFPYFCFIDSGLDIKNQLKNISIKDKVVFVPQTTVSLSSWELVKDQLSGHQIVQILPICPLYLKRSNQAIEFLRNVDRKKSVFLVCGDKASSNAKEIFCSIRNQYPDIPGFIVLKKEDFPYQDFLSHDFYVASATSVSKTTVEDLKKDLDSLQKIAAD